MMHFIDLLEEAHQPGIVPPEINQISTMFKHSRHFVSSELKDKVYSFAELVKRPLYHAGKEDTRRRDLRVRYQDDIAQVYLEAAWYVLLCGDDLVYLAQAGCWYQDVEWKNTRVAALPSWVPDLATTPIGGSLHEAAYLHGTGWQAAGGNRWRI